MRRPAFLRLKPSPARPHAILPPECKKPRQIGATPALVSATSTNQAVEILS